MPLKVVTARQKQVSENGSMQLHLSQVCGLFFGTPGDPGFFLSAYLRCLIHMKGIQNMLKIYK